MLNVNDHAPDFSFTTSQGPATLHQQLKLGPVVLYFYPSDFTPICTAEACAFRDSYADLSAAGLQVVGVSPQSKESHDKFSAKHALPFPLVADTDKSIAKSYGVTGPFGLGIRRATYLIAPNAIITDRTVADLRVSQHNAFIQRALSLANQRTEPRPTS